MVEYSYVDDGGLVVRINLQYNLGSQSLEYLHYNVDFDTSDPEPTYEVLTFDTPIDTQNKWKQLLEVTIGEWEYVL